jgi:hypothetical protein
VRIDTAMKPLMDILELARWAPSGDNTQPWRFAIDDEDTVVVYGHDTRAHCVYDLDGHASQVSLGALLETIALTGTRFGLAATIERRKDSSDERPVFDVSFRSEAGRTEDPLVPQITERRVQRRPLRLRALTEREKRALESAVGSGFAIHWWEGWRERSKVAWLNFANAKLRLTVPEAYRVHRDVIEWDVLESADRIPDAALGASAPTLKAMRWAMANWERIAFLNRYLAGTIAPRLELDLIPGLACAAHCLLVAQRAPGGIDDYVAAGRAVQRFWLTATGLGLQFQPEYTPLVFARYAREGVRFTESRRALDRALAVGAALDRLVGTEVALRAMFLGRIGAGEPARARSLRLPLPRLMEGRADPPA